MPSRKRRADETYEGRGLAGGPPPEVASARRRAVAEGDRDAGITGPPPWAREGWRGTLPTPTGRRRSTIPVIEMFPRGAEGGRAGWPGALEGTLAGGGGSPRTG